MLKWIGAIELDREIAVYFSDVSGAFDRVLNIIFVAKLRAEGFHPDLIKGDPVFAENSKCCSHAGRGKIRTVLH